MNILDVLKKIFGRRKGHSVPGAGPVTGTIRSLWVDVDGDMTKKRQKRREHVCKRDDEALAARGKASGKHLWRLVPHGMNVRANTKSEARAKFKRLIQDAENLSFRPERITRLPVGCKVKRMDA